MIYTNRASKSVQSYYNIFLLSLKFCNHKVLKLDRSLDQVINRKYLKFSEGRALISIEWQSDKLGGVQIGAGSAPCAKQKLYTAFCEIWNLH